MLPVFNRLLYNLALSNSRNCCVMERKKNLQTDYFTRPLLEMISFYLQQILQEVRKSNNNLNKPKSAVGSSGSNKTLEKDLFNSDETAVLLGISRRTLFTLRKAGKIGFTRIGNKIMFTRENIEEFKRVNSL